MDIIDDVESYYYMKLYSQAGPNRWFQNQTIYIVGKQFEGSEALVIVP